MARRTARGFWAFTLIWFGQLISLVGSGLTSFALGVWVYQTTDSVTSYALMVLCTMAPNILLSPLAGVLVDRWDRRWAMVLSDTGAGLSTLTIVLLLSLAEGSELWPILLATAVSSAFSAFQWPAYAASTTLLVPKEQLGRANGLVQFAQAIGYIASPALAGFLVVRIKVQGVVLIDFATFAFAVTTLLLVRIPRPEAPAEEEMKRSLTHEIIFGLKYLTTRPGLMGLLTLFVMSNFSLGLIIALFTPMVLSFTDADVLGVMTSVGASGMLFGGGLMSVWGGPRRRINGVLGCMLLEGLALLISGMRPSVPLVTATAFGFFFFFPIDGACNDAIWQGKVAPEVQGRVFGMRSTIAMSSMVPAYALAGPLADKVFEPLLVAEGPLVASVGHIIGVGEGRGIGLMFTIAGLLTILAAVGGYLHPRIRRIEDELPDAIADETESDKIGIA
jgi:DHA3 family macrolide efflux protein-like MFS transporter